MQTPNRRNAQHAHHYRRHPWSVRVLDPATAAQVSDEEPPLPTAYVGPRVIFPKTADSKAIEKELTLAAKDLGWVITVEDEDSRTRDLAYGVIKVGIRVADGRAVRPPDGFLLLQEARARSKTNALRTVGLDHVLHATDIGSD